MAWGHAALGALVLATSALEPGWGGWAGSRAIGLLAWSALLPASIGVALATLTDDPLAAVRGSGLPWYALPAPALVGAALLLGWATLARRGSLCRRVARAGLACAVLTAILSGVGVLGAAARERSAERLFLRMTSGDDPPWQVPAARATARELAGRYPETRWASEAWRVLALDAELRGAPADAARAWRGFERCFADYELPGRALAALGLARALDGRVPADELTARYLAARHGIARAGPDTQSWIALRAAVDLARLARQGSLYATASYWESRTTAPDEHAPTRDGG